MNTKLRTRAESVAENPALSYERDAYIVGDSLSVGITTGVNVTKNAVKGGMQTHWMFEQVQKDISTLKNKKVMFLLGGTNDVFSNKSASQIIANIDKIAEIARQNGVKVVVGTIPPFTHDTKTVQNAMRKLGTNVMERSAVIAQVNNHIRSKYDFIDYHKMLEDPNKPNNIDPKYEGKNQARDGIHPYNAYSMMRQAQKDKLATLGNIEKGSQNNEKNLQNSDTKLEGNIESPTRELENSIQNLENSIHIFETTLMGVFAGQEMTPEQKEKSDAILSEKKNTLQEMKKLFSNIQSAANEFQLKNRELSVYESADKAIVDSREITQQISDLQKRILELDEQQSILLKDFRLLHSGIKINDMLSAEEIESLRIMTPTDFLQFSREKRLQSVTVGNILPEKILSGEVKDLEINFSFNGRFNRALYRGVTAGMIFPAEVREIISGWEKFSRKNLEWEFFSEKWQRLVIRDETRLTIEKLETTANLQKNFVSSLDEKNFQNTLDLEIAREAEKRWISQDVALWFIKPEIEKISNENSRRATMEDLFVEIDRKKWYFYRNTGTPAVDSNGKMSLGFLSYLSAGDENFYKNTAEKIGYSSEEIAQNTVKTEPRDYSRWVDLSRIMSAEITESEIQRIRSIKKFEPNSQDAILLFRIAAKVAGFPEDWAKNPNLHYILSRESNGKVGILNYTIKWMGLDEFYKRANSSSGKNPIGSKSTASGLGQLLLSNVDIYYPDGRKGIGDPINEAVGFMRYITDRYGNPDVAREMYGRTGSYMHPEKWRQHKGFREWY